MRWCTRSPRWRGCGDDRSVSADDQDRRARVAHAPVGSTPAAFRLGDGRKRERSGADHAHGHVFARSQAGDVHHPVWVTDENRPAGGKADRVQAARDADAIGLAPLVGENNAGLGRDQRAAGDERDAEQLARHREARHRMKDRDDSSCWDGCGALRPGRHDEDEDAGNGGNGGNGERRSRRVSLHTGASTRLPSSIAARRC